MLPLTLGCVSEVPWSMRWALGALVQVRPLFPPSATSLGLGSYLPFSIPPCAATVTSLCLGNNCYNVRGSRVLQSASSWVLDLAVQPVTSQGVAGAGHHRPGPGRVGLGEKGTPSLTAIQVLSMTWRRAFHPMEAFESFVSCGPVGRGD